MSDTERLEALRTALDLVREAENVSSEGEAPVAYFDLLNGISRSAKKTRDRLRDRMEEMRSELFGENGTGELEWEGQKVEARSRTKLELDREAAFAILDEKGLTTRGTVTEVVVYDGLSLRDSLNDISMRLATGELDNVDASSLIAVALNDHFESERVLSEPLIKGLVADGALTPEDVSDMFNESTTFSFHGSE